MNYKQEISRKNFKAGYVLVKGIIDGSEYGCDDYEMTHAETPSGDYIGNSKDAFHICKKRGIKPEKAKPTHGFCSIGFCEKEQKWYGWSHRAMYGFGVGSAISKGDCGFMPDTPEELIEEHAHWLDCGFDEDNLKRRSREEIEHRNADMQAQRRAECQILPDRTGIRILHAPLIIPVLKNSSDLADALDGVECEAEAIDLNPSHSIQLCGRGKWTATTLEEAKQMACDFAESVS